MADRASALTRLVGDADRFLDERFGRAPLHVRTGDAAAFDGLLSLDDVDRLVAATGLRAPSFRLVRDGRTLPRSAVTRSVRIGSRPVSDLVDVQAVHREFAAGASIVLQGLHRSFAPVAELCRSLEVSLTHPVQANAYLTPPVAQGLDLHADPHDVFAIQTHGVKRWVVHPPDGSEPWDLEVRAGDVLYLPAGARHAAQTLDRPSLHLTIGVRTTTWRDVLRRAVDDVLAEPQLDAPLPAGWADDPARHAEALTGHLRDLAVRLARADAVPPLEASADAFWSHRAPDLNGGLRDVLELDQLDDTTPLCRRPHATFRVRTDDEVVRVQLGDRELHLPLAAEEAVRRLGSLTVLVPKDLDDVADEPSRLVLCRRMVQEGLLTFARGTDGA
ncbi:cupin domain-containing protein [Nitriliruptor alkaliphilus]|uniref:cupin domain-containing protein n=1 Tax=Nitriliruptor alkaliphilus TaxID=427918 RepID=UPI000696EFAD|nr:cupin domain-containing protein [Nitriliruptor alkaliphilus]